MPPSSFILDVGIGNGSALIRNLPLITSKKLRFHGVDIDADYIKALQGTISDMSLASSLSCEHGSIYDHVAPPGKLYDGVYFSGSFMLMPDPAKCLLHVSSLMTKEEGGGERAALIYFTQTFQELTVPFVDTLKPILKWLTTIDFGKSTYEGDFLQVMKEGNVEVIDMKVISRNFLGLSTCRLVTAKPKRMK